MNFGTLCIIFEGWNILLNNEFRMYRPRVIYYLIYKTDLNGNIIEQNPMDNVFPKNSDCNYSPRGNHNVLTSSSTHGYCVININSINDKVFVVFWFYNMIIFIFLLIYTIIISIFQIGKIRTYRIRTALPLCNAHVHFIIENLTFGDIFLILKIQENISRITLQIFLQNLYNDLKGRNHHKTTYKTTFPVKISV